MGEQVAVARHVTLSLRPYDLLTRYFVCLSGEPDAADARRRTREHGERGSRAAGEGCGHAGGGGQQGGVGLAWVVRMREAARVRRPRS